MQASALWMPDASILSICSLDANILSICSLDANILSICSLDANMHFAKLKQVEPAC